MQEVRGEGEDEVFIAGVRAGGNANTYLCLRDVHDSSTLCPKQAQRVLKSQLSTLAG